MKSTHSYAKQGPTAGDKSLYLMRNINMYRPHSQV